MGTPWLQPTQDPSTNTTRFDGEVEVAGVVTDSLGWPAFRDRYELNFPTLADTDVWTTEKFLTAYQNGAVQTIVIPANTFTANTIGRTLNFVFDLGLQFVLPTDALAMKIYANGALLGSVGINLRQTANLPSGRAHILKIDASFMQTGWTAGTTSASGRFHGKNSLYPQDGVTGDIDIGGLVKSSDGTPSFNATVDQTITIGLTWNTRGNFGAGGITRVGNRFIWPTAAGSAVVGAILETSSENVLGSTRKIYARLNDNVTVTGNATATNGLHVIAANNSGIVTVGYLGGSYRAVEHGLTTAHLQAACYNKATKTFFVAGVGGVILKSLDNGTTWAAVTNAQTWDIYSMVPFGNGFVAVGNSTTQYLTSSDGVTVTTGTNTTSQVLRAVWINAAGNWLAVGASNAALWYNGSTVATGKSTGMNAYSVYFDEATSKWWVGGTQLWSTSDPSTSGTYAQATLPSSGFDAWTGTIGGINSKGTYMILCNIGGTHVLFSTNSGTAWSRLGYNNGLWFGDSASIRLGL
ncbi:MAG: hypothetical protein IPM06_18530 [Rhizobiales bacterium]|nr:hypothetical protein [Hyphomicrobiales bacterium]